jgi:hypothetical protein
MGPHTPPHSCSSSESWSLRGCSPGRRTTTAPRAGRSHPTRVRGVSIFLGENRRYIGKSQPKRPPTRTPRTPHHRRKVPRPGGAAAAIATWIHTCRHGEAAHPGSGSGSGHQDLSSQRVDPELLQFLSLDALGQDKWRWGRGWRGGRGGWRRPRRPHRSGARLHFQRQGRAHLPGR